MQQQLKCMWTEINIFSILVLGIFYKYYWYYFLINLLQLHILNFDIVLTERHVKTGCVSLDILWKWDMRVSACLQCSFYRIYILNIKPISYILQPGPWCVYHYFFPAWCLDQLRWIKYSTLILMHRDLWFAIIVHCKNWVHVCQTYRIWGWTNKLLLFNIVRSRIFAEQKRVT